MSRTIGANLATHLATRTHTRVKMLRLDLADGTAIGVTDHDRVLNFDLADGAIDYDPETGILPSAIALSEGFDADNFEVTGPIGDTVTLVAVLGGRFNRATVRLFEVNWNALADGAAELIKGYVASARVAGGRFIFEIRSDVDRFNQDIGSVITPYCEHDLGDAGCGYPVRPGLWQAATGVAVRGDWDAKVGDVVRPSTFTGFDYECTTAGTTGGSEPTWPTTLGGTVNDNGVVWTAISAAAFPAVASAGGGALTFAVDAFPVATVDGQFAYGTVEFLTGDLAGIRKMDIQGYTASTRTLEMLEPLPAAPAAGDTLMIRRGCLRTRVACRDTWRNTRNARAFFDVPGTDQVLKYPVPG